MLSDRARVGTSPRHATGGSAGRAGVAVGLCGRGWARRWALRVRQRGGRTAPCSLGPAPAGRQPRLRSLGLPTGQSCNERFLMELRSSAASRARFVINWTAAVTSRRKDSSWHYCETPQVCFTRAERQGCSRKTRHRSTMKLKHTYGALLPLHLFFLHRGWKLRTFTLRWHSSQQKPFRHCLQRISAGPFIIACLL